MQNLQTEGKYPVKAPTKSDWIRTIGFNFLSFLATMLLIGQFLGDGITTPWIGRSLLMAVITAPINTYITFLGVKKQAAAGARTNTPPQKNHRLIWLIGGGLLVYIGYTLFNHWSILGPG